MNIIENDLKTLIAKYLQIDEKDVTNDKSFVNDLGADSLDNLELVMAFEEKFGIEIQDEDLAKFATVQNVLDFIKAAKA